ncbi:hypothetical protein CAPTEDRAFT_166761 [Capitella teleta]|uniref:Ricin B lectin domain-containing protein n=1 Tax=Capitella teleta TaxID=283909 RepID=R7TKL1_CAPTE|nr:hypothetical protein CAPTEDRAFT_166761 [Capitella teleta]|eukprot:ELT91655.1 hypothetical protein CAPTEDRAFT_166761 [Capitella teleta]
MVLDVEQANEDPGARVITWPRGDDRPRNQLWWKDVRTGFIRSMLNGYGLEDGGDSLVTQPFNDGDSGQRWVVDDDCIRNHSTGKAFDVAGGSTDEGATVLAWDHHGDTNQQWDLIPETPRYFWIESRMNGKVLDVAGDNHEEGADVIMFGKKDEASDNQLWFEDPAGNIRSKMNGFHLDTSDGSLKTSNGHDEESEHFWLFSGEQIANFHNRNQVLDIAEGCDDDCAKVCAWDCHGESNQQWSRNYVD